MANIALNEDAQLNLNMEAMTVNTEGHCDEWNVRHQQLLENDQYLNGEQEKIKAPEFTPAAKRENIVSKEKLPKIFGKIARFFADLKKVAFSGSYNDLSDKPGIVNNNTTTQAGLALDARQANPNIEGTMAANILQLNNDSKSERFVETLELLNGCEGVLRYTVRNGICYVHLWPIRSQNTGRDICVYDKMPEAAICSGVFSSADKNCEVFAFIDAVTSRLRIHINTTNWVYAYFCYPVKL